MNDRFSSVSNYDSGFTLTWKHKIIESQWVEHLPQDRVMPVKKIAFYLTRMTEYHLCEDILLKYVTSLFPTL